jgi:thiamine pyrophosphate-dependent acetolactate synthase large subunit-like protein
MMGAGNSSSTIYNTNVNLNTFGGTKKQGITSRVGLDNWANSAVQTYSNGYGRNKLFCMNQLGGVGAGKSMFNGRFTQTDGVHCPDSQEPLPNESLPNESLPNESLKVEVSSDTVIEMLLNKVVELNGIGSNIYGVPGATTYQANNTIQNFISSNAIQYIHASNESSSVYMAAFEANLLNKVGITFSTAGPGSLMAITGIGTALFESVPIVSFFGVPVIDFQFINKDIFVPICKQVFYIDGNTINPQQLIQDAFRIAKKGTELSPGAGPVAIFVLDSCWTANYKYTTNPSIYPFIQNHNIDPFLRNIIANISTSSKLILRLGERVDPAIVKQLADLSNKYKNIFIMLTLLSKTYINPLDYPNVGIEGPTGNNNINALYKDATMVIDAGDGVDYYLIVYTDVYPLMNPSTPLFYILNSKSTYPPASSTHRNTLYADVNDALTQFLAFYKDAPPSTTSWADVRTIESNFISTQLTAYKKQTSPTRILTTISIVAHCIDIIYKNQTNKYYTNGVLETIIDDNLVYSTCVGLMSFLTISLLRNKTPMSISTLGEFSAIGSSISVAAGHLRTKKYRGAVLVLGDGGFLNVCSYLTDLRKVLEENPDYSILLLIMNDNCYTNVARGEEEMFGAFTSVTSTTSLQKGVDLGTIASAFFGSTLKQYLHLSELTSPTLELTNFVTNWYTTRPTGASILHYSTSTGQAFQITV